MQNNGKRFLDPRRCIPLKILFSHISCHILSLSTEKAFIITSKKRVIICGWPLMEIMIYFLPKSVWGRVIHSFMKMPCLETMYCFKWKKKDFTFDYSLEMAQSYPAHNRGAMFLWRFDNRVFIEWEGEEVEISFKYKINTNKYVKIKPEASSSFACF